MRNCYKLKIVISHPSDACKEVAFAKRSIQQWNVIYKEEPYVLIPFEWAEDVYPISGNYPQYSINEQIIDTSQFMIAIIHEKYGTPFMDNRNQYISGTHHEIRRFLEKRKPVLLFLNYDNVKNQKDQDSKNNVMNLLSDIENKVLYCCYSGLTDFTIKFPYFLSLFLNDYLLNINNGHIFTPHSLYGSENILSEARERIILDAVFYPYYARTGDLDFYKKLFQKNKNAKVQVIFPTKELVTYKDNLHFNGYKEYLDKNWYTENKIRRNIEDFINIKDEIKKDAGENFKIDESFKICKCSKILFNPYVIVDNTILVGFFSQSKTYTPNGCWVKLDIPFEMYENEKDENTFDKKYDVNKKAIKRFYDEYKKRNEGSEDIKSITDWD